MSYEPKLSPTMKKVLPLAQLNVHPKHIAQVLGIPKSSVTDAMFWLRRENLIPKANPKTYVKLWEEKKMSKSYVTILTCPWCKEEKNVLALDKRMRERFDMHTEDNTPCEKCSKENAILLFDKDTKQFLAYIKKEAMLNKEGLEKFKGTSVKMLGKIDSDGRVSVS